jgi:hypothetical protein
MYLIVRRSLGTWSIWDNWTHLIKNIISDHIKRLPLYFVVAMPYQMSCSARRRLLLPPSCLWTDRLKNCAGLHQILNVLAQNRVFRTKLQILLLKLGVISVLLNTFWVNFKEKDELLRPKIKNAYSFHVISNASKQTYS